MVFWLHNFLNFSNPALRTLIPTISVAYAFQIAVSIPAIIYQEDRFYGITYQIEREKRVILIRLIRILDVSRMYRSFIISSNSSSSITCKESGIAFTTIPRHYYISSTPNYNEWIDGIVDCSIGYITSELKLIQGHFCSNVS